ncbi:unnamed protein product [Blepharisma stoltei]|uniref:Uncharacterized protein n=1 Tax=Blepharisma stoltei TaxID=1481888 RepID=A0AAU9ITS4_9CILI|nr:unnamed protein product [Blepharisma stoltei]
MLRRVAASCLRRFSTVSPYYEEHYQYIGNPDLEEFQKFMLGERKKLVQDTTIFKPKEQIEFNRTGELLLYEAEPFRLKDVLTPYPYSVWSWSMPSFLYMYFANPFGLTWLYNDLFLLAGLWGWYPQVEYVFNLRYHINRLWLLRGGKVLKVEHSNVTGYRWKSWIFIDEINLLTEDKKKLEPEKGINAKILDDNNQLKAETHIQVDNFVDVGRNMQDHILVLCKDGQVHNPEILDAVLKGFEVDTSNFRINTLHTERWLEPNTNS